jgi:hypothetical protein
VAEICADFRGETVVPPGPGAPFRHLLRINIIPNKRSNQENALQAMLRVKKFDGHDSMEEKESRQSVGSTYRLPV